MRVHETWKLKWNDFVQLISLWQENSLFSYVKILRQEKIYLTFVTVCIVPYAGKQQHRDNQVVLIEKATASHVGAQWR